MTDRHHHRRPATSAARTPRAAPPRSCASWSRTSAPSSSSRRPRTSSSGPSRRSASASASPPRWATPCWPHLAAKVAPGVDVVFLDTGYHFAETIGTRDAVEATLDVNLLTITPEQSVAEQDAAYGKDLYKTDPDLCCALRKVQPLAESLRAVRRLGDRAAPGRDPQPGDRAGRRLGRQEGQGQGLARWPAGPTSRSSATSPRTACWSTRSSTTATPPSAAGPAPAASRPARTRAAAAGPAPTRPSAGSTHDPHPRSTAPSVVTHRR